MFVRLLICFSKPRSGTPRLPGCARFSGIFYVLPLRPQCPHPLLRGGRIEISCLCWHFSPRQAASADTLGARVYRVGEISSHLAHSTTCVSLEWLLFRGWPQIDLIRQSFSGALQSGPRYSKTRPPRFAPSAALHCGEDRCWRAPFPGRLRKETCWQGGSRR